MNVKFVSCFLDHSGYAQASRRLLLAMHKAGINITTQILIYQSDTKEYGEGGELAKKLEKKKIDYDIKIMMTTPDQAALQYETGKYNICAMFWEVLGLDKRWVEAMNKMDEIWTPSQVHADTFRHNGVYKPIRVIKIPIETTTRRKYKRLKIKKFDGFTFYSVFQWTERKNPKALLEAYWQAFEGKKDVCLLLKTYKANFNESERERIRIDINEWKQNLKLKHYPKVFLVLGVLSNKEMMRIHSTGDCFVSAHRGEGLGLPQVEAMSIGNPVISTNFGGVHEFFDNNNSWLIDYKWCQVSNMVHIPWYNSQQLWADIDVKQLKKSMLEAYSDRKLLAQKGKLAKALIKDSLDTEVIGMDILKKLEAIKL